MFTQEQMNWLDKNCVRPWTNPCNGKVYDTHCITIDGVDHLIDFCADSTKIYGIMANDECLEYWMSAQEYQDFCNNLYNTIPGDTNE